jgi:hypothetical protein
MVTKSTSEAALTNARAEIRGYQHDQGHDDDPRQSNGQGSGQHPSLQRCVTIRFYRLPWSEREPVSG